MGKRKGRKNTMKKYTKAKKSEVAVTTSDTNRKLNLNLLEKATIMDNHSIKTDLINTDNQAQQHRLLKHLQEHGSITTIEARDKLNILHPSGRVKELRQKDYEIITYRITVFDTHGRPHSKVGKYVYKGKKTSPIGTTPTKH